MTENVRTLIPIINPNIRVGNNPNNIMPTIIPTIPPLKICLISKLSFSFTIKTTAITLSMSILMITAFFGPKKSDKTGVKIIAEPKPVITLTVKAKKTSKPIIM